MNDWSGDGKHLLLTRWDEKGSRQTWLLSEPLDSERHEPVLLANGIHSEFAPAIGAPRWLSYDDEHRLVDVRTMPSGPHGNWQVSPDYGNGTRWRRDGREMYFSVLGGGFAVVEIGPGPAFRAAAPQVLFPLPPAMQAGMGQYAQGYDVTADGEKFLATLPAPDTPAAAITVVLNWQASLEK